MTTFTLYKTAQCPRINVKQGATLTYEIHHDNKYHLHIKLIANSGGGFFSSDTIALKKVTAVLTSLPDTSHFSSTVFRCLFMGKSANNSSFLAAVLRAEGLIAPSPSHTYRHIIGDIDALSHYVADIKRGEVK